MVQSSSLLHGFAKTSLNTGFAHFQWFPISDKHFKRLICLGSWRKNQVPSFNVNLSICPSHLPQNPFQNNENCDSCITAIYQLEFWKLYRYPLLCAIVTSSFMRSLFIAFKNDEWYVFNLQRLFHFIACGSFLSISPFFLIFLWSPLLAEVLR